MLNKADQSTIQVLAETMHSMDVALYNDIIIECGDEDIGSDMIYLCTKSKPVTDDSYKYDGLIHKINAAPNHEGVLTFSYHLCPEFDRLHLFYGQEPHRLGTHIPEHNLSDIMCLLFEEQKRDYDVMVEPISEKLIYIPQVPEQNHYTKIAIETNYFREDFESDKQLFYYLKWRCRMQAINGNLKKYLFRDGAEIVIFHTDLTCNSHSTPVYVFAAKNDKQAVNDTKIEKWQMNGYFVTAAEIKSKYGVNVCDLPSSLNPRLTEEYMKIDIDNLIQIKNNLLIDSLESLPVIKTNKARSNKTKSGQSKVVRIRKSELFQAIQKSNDAKYFRPIISFKDGKTEYCVDMILLIDIGRSYHNWIGLIFRGKETQNQMTMSYCPIGIAVDCIDIRNKATLFEAKNFNDNDGYQWIKNENIGKLVVSNDDDQLKEFKKQFEELKKDYMELKHEHMKLQHNFQQIVSHNNELKEINNYYFQQIALNPNRNIAPHWRHVVDLTQTKTFVFNVHYPQQKK